MNDNTLVKIARHGTCIEISTYSRKFGKHGRFMIVAGTLAEYFFSGDRKRHFFDTDCGNILEMSFRDGKCIMDFTWLSHWSNGHVEGVAETVVVPQVEMIDFMCFSERDRKLLSGEQMEDGKVEFTESAMRNIRNLDVRQRRAFCKAMARGALRWPNTETRVWADGSHDFYFLTNDGMCGGLILHDYNGKAQYGVHT